MIELRWLVKKIPWEDSKNDRYPTIKAVKKKEVLQYRTIKEGQIINFNVYSSNSETKLIWSEWKDVPTVDDS